MSIVFPRDVEARLVEIEALEGMPQQELIQQAVGIWAMLRADERLCLGAAAMQLVVERRQTGGRT